MKRLDLRCSSCDRFLRIEAVGTTIAKVICPDRKCKKVNNLKVIIGAATQQQVNFKFTDDNAVAISDREISLEAENQQLKDQLTQSKEYARELEGIIDGQG